MATSGARRTTSRNWPWGKKCRRRRRRQVRHVSLMSGNGGSSHREVPLPAYAALQTTQTGGRGAIKVAIARIPIVALQVRIGHDDDRAAPDLRGIKIRLLRGGRNDAGEDGRDGRSQVQMPSPLKFARVLRRRQWGSNRQHRWARSGFRDSACQASADSGRVYFGLCASAGWRRPTRSLRPSASVTAVPQWWQVSQRRRWVRANYLLPAA